MLIVISSSSYTMLMMLKLWSGPETCQGDGFLEKQQRLNWKYVHLYPERYSERNIK